MEKSGGNSVEIFIGTDGIDKDSHLRIFKKKMGDGKNNTECAQKECSNTQDVQNRQEHNSSEN